MDNDLKQKLDERLRLGEIDISEYEEIQQLVCLHVSSPDVRPSPPPIPQQNIDISRPWIAQSIGSFPGKIVDDISGLRMQLLLPFSEIKTFYWLKDKGILGMLIVGLWPLFCILLIGGDLKATYWAIAFYFSAIWALYFYVAFAPEQVKKVVAIACFFGTGIVSIGILMFLYLIPPFGALANLGSSEGFIPRILGMFLGVAIPEEISKALVLLVILKTSKSVIQPTTLLFYGLISGLGFGIYEGVSYQTEGNIYLAENPAEYYLLNVMRLTTLPFLHSIWTGIAGYFLAFSALFSAKRHGLVVVAILIPAFFHTAHNTFGGIIGLVADAIAVLMLLIYLSKSAEMATGLKGGIESDG